MVFPEEEAGLRRREWHKLGSQPGSDVPVTLTWAEQGWVLQGLHGAGTEQDGSGSAGCESRYLGTASNTEVLAEL